jgi:hypothetical protein
MKRLGVFFICAVVLLSWCGRSTSVERRVTLEGYSFTLPADYIELSPSLVENKQLINKVIWSYKLPAEVLGEFEPNIIITRSDLPPELNFEQFWTLNTQKLNAQLAGYQAWSKEVISFTCGDRDVQWLLVFFRLQDPWYTTNPEVWLAQYQFVNNQKWYIISAAYKTENDQKSFRSLVETITCASPSE